MIQPIENYFTNKKYLTPLQKLYYKEAVNPENIEVCYQDSSERLVCIRHKDTQEVIGRDLLQVIPTPNPGVVVATAPTIGRGHLKIIGTITKTKFLGTQYKRVEALKDSYIVVYTKSNHLGILNLKDLNMIIQPSAKSIQRNTLQLNHLTIQLGSKYMLYDIKENKVLVKPEFDQLYIDPDDSNLYHLKKQNIPYVYQVDTKELVCKGVNTKKDGVAIAIGRFGDEPTEILHSKKNVLSILLAASKTRTLEELQKKYDLNIHTMERIKKMIKTTDIHSIKPLLEDSDKHIKDLNIIL